MCFRKAYWSRKIFNMCIVFQGGHLQIQLLTFDNDTHILIYIYVFSIFHYYTFKLTSHYKFIIFCFAASL